VQRAKTTMTPREVISIQYLWAGYEHEPVLEDINLSVKELDFIGLIGPNGGGKTTLIKVLLGLLPPMRGEVRIMDQSVKKGRRHIGYVPQTNEFDRDFPIKVRDVVRLGRLGKRRLMHPYTSEDDKIVAETLRQVGVLNLQDRPIGELSGGQLQRVYIARALATKPKIMLLDEPVTSVDVEATSRIYELLNDLNKRMTILLISHDVGVISSYVKTIGCLNRRLYYHDDKHITSEMLEAAYHCPVDLIAHGVPHRVFPDHMEERM
jgi:zinc transport system ATP-binding protein